MWWISLICITMCRMLNNMLHDDGSWVCFSAFWVEHGSHQLEAGWLSGARRRRPGYKVLRKLLADKKLNGYHQFALKEYKDGTYGPQDHRHRRVQMVAARPRRRLHLVRPGGTGRVPPDAPALSPATGSLLACVAPARGLGGHWWRDSKHRALAVL